MDDSNSIQIFLYDRSCSLFNIVEIFSFGSCVQGVKTIQGTKTFLKTLENDARVHIALFFNWNIKDLGTMLYQGSIHYPVGKLVQELSVRNTCKI